MCLELKFTTLRPIVGKSPKGIDCSGNVLPEWLRIFVVETIKRAYVNENTRKQPVVIVIQAKDEEEVVDGPCCPLYYGTLQDKNGTFCSSSLNAGNL